MEEKRSEVAVIALSFLASMPLLRLGPPPRSFADYPALRSAAFSVGLEHYFQQVDRVRIVHALCYFRQEAIIASTKIYDSTLLFINFDQFHERMTVQIFACGGSVEKYIGDEISPSLACPSRVARTLLTRSAARNE